MLKAIECTGKYRTRGAQDGATKASSKLKLRTEMVSAELIGWVFIGPTGTSKPNDFIN